MQHVNTALLSVSDKSGLVEFASRLVRVGVSLLSTGGTAEVLRQAGLPLQDVAEVTGFPELLDGRVKTLHPKIHAGILALRDNPTHQQQMAEHGIQPIDLVVVNLYPFQASVARGAGRQEIVENIDIGGPALIRAAAKNSDWVGVVVDPADYDLAASEIERQGGLSGASLARLARKAFEHTAAYDAAIATYLQEQAAAQAFPETLLLAALRRAELQYGENPHQQAALYQFGATPRGILAAEQLAGPLMSYNNYLDAEAAYGLVAEFEECAAVIVKHNNPCGVALAASPLQAYQRAYEADPTSAFFGAVVALNRPVDMPTAEAIGSILADLVIAPAYAPEAIEHLGKRKKRRVLRLPLPLEREKWLVRGISGGLLLQHPDADFAAKWEPATSHIPTAAQERDLRFAYTVVKHVKSNAIVVAKEGVTLGIGAGQMNRVGSMRIALAQAGEAARGAVAASDGFFFPDTVEEAARAGIVAIAQPGGSVKDSEVIEAAERLGISLILTGTRHFRH